MSGGGGWRRLQNGGQEDKGDSGHLGDRPHNRNASSFMKTRGTRDAFLDIFGQRLELLLPNLNFNHEHLEPKNRDAEVLKSGLITLTKPAVRKQARGIHGRGYQPSTASITES